jgi:hypothetical protein
MIPQLRNIFIIASTERARLRNCSNTADSNTYLQMHVLPSTTELLQLFLFTIKIAFAIHYYAQFLQFHL